MPFIELVIEEATNKIVAWQEYETDRKDKHDWGLDAGEIFERVSGALPTQDGITEIHRYIWNPISKEIEFDPLSKSGEALLTEQLASAQQKWDQQKVIIDHETNLSVEFKEVIYSLLGDRPIKEDE